MESSLFFISSISLILIGLYGILTKSHFIKILLALNIMETGVNLFIVATGYIPNKEAPIITSIVQNFKGIPFVDPLPQALVLTSIVIGLGTTALALALIIRHYKKIKSITFEDTPSSIESEVDS